MHCWLKERELKIMPKCLLSVPKKSNKVLLLIFILAANQINRVKRQKVILRFSIRSRSSHSQISFKIGALNIFTIFIGIQLYQSLFLIKLQKWRPTTLLKTGCNTGVSCKCCFFYELIHHLILLTTHIKYPCFSCLNYSY